jgi:hypothetical protein
MVYGEVDRHCVLPCADLGRCGVSEFMKDYLWFFLIVLVMGVASAGGGK